MTCVTGLRYLCTKCTVIKSTWNVHMNMCGTALACTGVVFVIVDKIKISPNLCQVEDFAVTAW